MAELRTRPAPRGEMIDIGGRCLHVVRAGPRQVGFLVLLEAGSFGFSADWAVVQAQLAERGIGSIAYDRAGLAHSDPGPEPRDAEAILADLEQLLAALGEPGPFIVVGHSMAGLHIHLFAVRHPGQIAGLVFVDAFDPELSADPLVSRGAAQYVRFARAAGWAAARGLLGPLSPWGDQIGLPDDAAAHKRWAFADPDHNRAAAAEVAQWEPSVAQGLAAGTLDPAWPVAVVRAGPQRGTARQRALQAAPAERSRRGFQDRVVRASHASLIGRRHAASVVRAIVQVRAAAMEAAA